MSYARRMTRPDATQQEIVEGLRKAGVQVWIIGQPCDLLTYYRGVWRPLECKPLKGIRHDQQVQDSFLAATGVQRVRNASEAIAAVVSPYTNIVSGFSLGSGTISGGSAGGSQ